MAGYETSEAAIASKETTPEQEVRQAEGEAGGDFEFEEGTETEGQDAIEVEVDETTEPAGTVQPQPDPYAAYGGEQAVRDAMVLAQAYIQGIAEPADEVEEEGEEWPDFFEGVDDDDVLTGAQAKALFGSFAERVEAALEQYVESATQPIKSAEEQRRQDVANDAVHGALMSLGVETDGMKRAVLAAAGAYLGPEDWNPRVIAEAVRRGHADVVAELETERKSILKNKRQQAKGQPKRLGSGGTSGGGSGAPPEPRDLKEAIERARQARRAAGG